MRCPYCGSDKTQVIDTTHDARGGIRRRRICKNCKRRFSSYERAVMATPLLIKRDGRRVEFDPDKLKRSIQVAVGKRPVAQAEIERLVGEIETKLQALGKPEVDARLVGDMVMDGLRELDPLAYIRYAIVYLEMSDLDAVRTEIDRLLEQSESIGSTRSRV
jgi:transcriptional repressor NrdR